MTLEYQALHWLHWEKRCQVVLFERGPRIVWSGQPDVLGVTKHRYLYEIEVKRTVSDFRANARKRFHSFRNIIPHGAKYPKHFWFLVPPEIVERVRPLLPSWAGLLCNIKNHSRLHVVEPAPPNIMAEPLTPNECVRLAHCMANQIMALARGMKDEHQWDYAI